MSYILYYFLRIEIIKLIYNNKINLFIKRMIQFLSIYLSEKLERFLIFR